MIELLWHYFQSTPIQYHPLFYNILFLWKIINFNRKVYYMKTINHIYVSLVSFFFIIYYNASWLFLTSFHCFHYFFSVCSLLQFAVAFFKHLQKFLLRFFYFIFCFFNVHFLHVFLFLFYRSHYNLTFHRLVKYTILCFHNVQEYMVIIIIKYSSCLTFSTNEMECAFVLCCVWVCVCYYGGCCAVN